MKKILLLLIGLTIISCGGSDDDDVLRTTDPIIGTWSFEGNDDDPFTNTYKSDGTITLSNTEVENEFLGTWRNNGSDFNELTQNYTINTGSPVTTNYIFSTDFNTISVCGNLETSEGTGEYICVNLIRQ